MTVALPFAGLALQRPVGDDGQVLWAPPLSDRTQFRSCEPVLVQ